MTMTDEILDAFSTVAVCVRAKINRLCNDGKHFEAERLERALDLIMVEQFGEQNK